MLVSSLHLSTSWKYPSNKLSANSRSMKLWWGSFRSPDKKMRQMCFHAIDVIDLLMCKQIHKIFQMFCDDIMYLKNLGACSWKDTENENRLFSPLSPPNWQTGRGKFACVWPIALETYSTFPNIWPNLFYVIIISAFLASSSAHSK